MDRIHRGRWWYVLLLIAALAAPIVPAGTALAATRTVDSLSDTAVDAGHCTDAIAGNCTLRDAIAAALPNDIISFGSLTGRITLSASRGPLVLASNVTIQGPGRDLLIIDGGCTTCGPGGTRSDGVRVLIVNTGVTATISGVTITKGRGGSDSDGGGGILNNGTLTVAGSTITGNATSDSSALGGSNGGDGGGIYNRGTLVVTNSTISSNGTGKGSNQTNGGPRDGGNGGGIDNYYGTLTLTNTTVTNNYTGQGGDDSSGNAGNGGDGGGIDNYYGTLTITGSTITSNIAGGGGSGTTVASNGTTNRGGKGGGIYHISNSSSPSLTIANSTISSNVAGNGGTYSDNYGFIGSPGGGIYNAGPATITASAINYNGAGGSAGFSGSGGDGGGIYNIGTLTLAGTTLTGNSSGSGSTGHSQDNSFSAGGNGGNGGGIANGSLNYGFSEPYHGTLTMTGGTLSNNHTGSGGNGGGGTSGGNSGWGGGIFSNGTFTMTGVTLSSNATGSGGTAGSAGSGTTGGNGGDGGGILAYSDDFTIAGSILTGNSTGTGGGSGGRRGYGGGIYNTDAQLMVRSSSFDHDNARFGGGIWNANGATLTLTGSTITNNATDDGASGGGLYNESDATIANSTFSSNTATYGAGIMNAPPTGKTLSLRNDTIANNTASRVGGGDSKGGGLYQASSALDIGNTLLTANTAAGATYDYHDGTGGAGVTSRGHNFIHSFAGIFPVQPSDIIGNTQTVVGPLADNGGTTVLPDGTHPKTHALLTTCTPANVCPLDNADAAMCAASPVSDLDERGLPRPPSTCDIGAYEVQVQPNNLPAQHPGGTNAGGSPAPVPARPAGPSLGAGAPTPLPEPTRRG